MLVCYIFTKQKKLIIKLVGKSNYSVFTWNGMEYYINPDFIYSKKFLGLKTFFWSMYIQGNPNPVEFKDDGIRVSGEVPLDEIAILMRKIRQGLLGSLAEICAIGCLVISFVILYLVWEIASSMDVI